MSKIAVLSRICLIYSIFNVKVNSYLPASQVEALNDLYLSLNGDNWYGCQWNFSLLATNDTLPKYYCFLTIEPVTNNTQTIYQIDFWEYNNLSGTISQSIDALQDLEELRFNGGWGISGVIPNTLCNLPYLSIIYIWGSNLYGTVPQCVGNLSLTSLVFTSSPSLEMNSYILELLCLNAQDLSTISFYGIQFMGSIPECIGNKLPKLTYISFYNLPNLTSTMPQSFGKLQQISYFRLSGVP
eukprot:450482_1